MSAPEPAYVLPIVEGHGDAAAVPVLIHRIWRDLLKLEGTLVVLPPIREKRASFPVADKLRRPLELAASKLAQAGPGRKLILVMFDADDDCIRDLSASVRMTCQTYVGHMNFKCVIANPMFETWIVAGAETLQQHLDLSDGDVPDDVEAERCRKSWIQHRMPSRRTYSETIDQPKLVRHIDLAGAQRRSRSFERLVNVLRCFAAVT